MTMTEPTRTGLVADEWLTVAVVSLTVNACVLLRGVVSHVVRGVVRWTNNRQSKSTDCESGIRRSPTCRKRCDDVLVSAVTEMLLCSACAVLGLGVAVSKVMRTTPLSGVLDRTTLILLSAALGRFIFTVVHMLGQFCRRTTDVTIWTMFRAVYAIVSVICLSVIIFTGYNLVLAAVILILELGIAVEEASRAVDRFAVAEVGATSTVQDRLERALKLVGVLLVVIQMLLPTTLLMIAIFRLQSPFVLGPPEIGLLCFAVVFYTLTGLVLLSSQHRRRRLEVPQLLKVRPASTTVSRQKVLVRRRALVGAMSVDGKRRRVLRRSGAEYLLRAVRGRRVCSTNVYNAIRIAAAGARGLGSNIGSQRRRVTLSTA